MFPSKRKASKRKSYNKAKRERMVLCPCGGSFLEGVFTNLPRYKHENTKMHQDYLSNGNVMNTKVKAKLDKKAADKKAEKDDALARRRDNQTLCGCGSFVNKAYVDGGRGEDKHFGTAKHVKWALKNE